MIQKIRLTESDIKTIVEGAVTNLLMELGKTPGKRDAMAKAAKRALMKKKDPTTYLNAISSLNKQGASKDEMSDFQQKFEKEDFNGQPVNDIATNESRNLYKVNESQLFSIIRESVNRILAEAGEKHRFGRGKFGLAMDAANKARALGRIPQANNLTKHAAEAFNNDFATNDFRMDDSGALKHIDGEGIERTYLPKSERDKLYKNITLDGGQKKYNDALLDNGFIKNAAQTAKAFPRKKMTGGLDAIEDVDEKLYKGIYR